MPVVSDHEGEKYHVHFFSRKLQDAKLYHGKIITLDKFRSDPSDYPDPRLIQYHYKQCAMMWLRGLAVGMQIPKTSAAAMERFGR